MKLSSKLKTTVIGLFLFLLSLQVVYSQDFSSLDQDLASLEDLINDTIASTEEQQKLLADLRQNLNESGATITEQEKLLKDLQTQLTEMSETFKKQSALLAKSEQKSKFWRNFTLIAIPATALISGFAARAAR